MTSSADLPEGFLAEVFRNGCQCDHCVKWRAEVARLREAICAWAELEYMDMAHDPDRWERYLRAGTRLVEIAREGK